MLTDGYNFDEDARYNYPHKILWVYTEKHKKHDYGVSVVLNETDNNKEEMFW